jgi:membrane protein
MLAVEPAPVLRLGQAMKWTRQREHLGIRADTLLKRVDQLCFGAASIIGAAMHGLSATRSSESASSIAYYTVFSLFPLLLLLVAGAGFVLRSAEAQQRLLQFALEAFPVSQSELERNLQLVLDRRGAIGVVGLLSLLWSGTGGLGVLFSGISRAWPEARRRSFVTYRLAAVGIGVLITLLALSVIATTALEIVPQLEAMLWGGGSLRQTRLWPAFSAVLPAALAFLVFVSLYRWVPAASGSWRAAFLGSFTATLAWRITTWAFVWFLGSGLVRYERIYGSLSAIVALLSWVYLSAQIVLLGAHLCAAIERYTVRSALPTGREVSAGRGGSPGDG